MTHLTTDAEATLQDLLLERLPQGSDHAIRGSELAAELGISERMVRILVEDLCDAGVLIGSSCSGERRGYFVITDLEDLDVGTAHLRSRALSMLHRYATVRRSATSRFGDEALRLFDIDGADGAMSLYSLLSLVLVSLLLWAALIVAIGAAR